MNEIYRQAQCQNALLVAVSYWLEQTVARYYTYSNYFLTSLCFSHIRRQHVLANTVPVDQRCRLREHTYKYFLLVNGAEDLKVCKVMFLGTLGYPKESTFAKNMMRVTSEDSPAVVPYASGGDRNSYDRDVSNFPLSYHCEH
mgnify:FL=1